MKYSKPEVVMVESAVLAIQMGVKDPTGPLEAPLEVNHTIGAYEADE